MTVRRLLVVSLLVGMILAGYTLRLQGMDKHHVSTDARVDSLPLSENLAFRGAFSKSELSDPPVPTAIRPPGFTTYLAFVRLVHSMVPSGLVEKPGYPSNTVWKLTQLPFLVLGGLLVFGIARQLQVSSFGSFAAGGLAGLSPGLFEMTIWLKPDPLAAVLLLSVSYLLYRTVRNPTIWRFALAGAYLGVLASIKALFVYFLPVLILAGLVYAWQINSLYRCGVGLTVLSIVALSVIGPWYGRNYQVSDGMVAYSTRGGSVMNLRRVLNEMSGTERLMAPAFFLHRFNAPPMIQRVTGIDIESDPAYEQLVEYRRVHHEDKQSAARTLNQSGMTSIQYDITLDKTLRDRALIAFVTNPVDHAVTTVLMLWRGLFVEKLYFINFSPLVYAGIFGLLAVLSMVYYTALAYSVYRAVRTKSLTMIAFCLPVLYSVGFHAVLTQNLARFHLAEIPVLALVTVRTVETVASRMMGTESVE